MFPEAKSTIHKVYIYQSSREVHTSSDYPVRQITVEKVLKFLHAIDS